MQEYQPLSDNDSAYLETISLLSRLPIAAWPINRGIHADIWLSAGSMDHPCRNNIAFRNTLELSCQEKGTGIYMESNRVGYGLVVAREICIALGPFSVAADVDMAAYGALHGMPETNDLQQADLQELERFLKLIVCYFQRESEKQNLYRIITSERNQIGTLKKTLPIIVESDRIAFVKQHIRDICGGHFWQFGANNQLEDYDWEILLDTGITEINGKIIQGCREACVTRCFPYIYPETKNIFHIAVEDRNGRLSIIGPICSGILTEKELEEYAQNHGINKDMLRIPSISASHTTYIASVFCFLITGESHSLAAVTHINNVLGDLYLEGWLKYRMDAMDDEQVSVNDERAWISSYFLGGDNCETHLMDNGQSKVYLGHIPGNRLKEEEYKAVLAIALGARGAINHGMGEQESLVTADYYLQKVAAADSVTEYLQIQKDALSTMGGMLRFNWKDEEEVGLSARCKRYIERHLTEHLTVEGIAEAIGISRNYLSHFFSQDTGMTLSQYIQEKKIDRASEMLRYTNMEIAEIAATLEYCSQSHFGKIFREHIGVTPQKYRARYRAGLTR